MRGMTLPSLSPATCVRVLDGDTLELRFADTPHPRLVQLAAVSAPEKGEPYWRESAAYLAALAEGREVQVQRLETDRFGREVCRLYCGETELNREMVRQGWARHHHRYTEVADYAAEEAESIAARRGMWATLTPRTGEAAAEKEGTCLKVLDGDTIIFREAGAVDSIKIRLWGIDAPEKGQSFGAEATRKLARLIEHKAVRLRFHEEARESAEGRDGYSRDLATIFRRGRNINLELEQGGYAWHYAYYAPDAAELAEAHRAAREARLGLWAEEAPMEPRLFRLAQRRSGQQ